MFLFIYVFDFRQTHFISRVDMRAPAPDLSSLERRREGGRE